jgi:hypothetical protein
MPTTTPASNFSDLLERATTEPGTLSAAYFAFHGYSLGNQLLAMFQCQERGIALGPIALQPAEGIGPARSEGTEGDRALYADHVQAHDRG